MGLYKFRYELLQTLTKEHEVAFCVPEGDYAEKLVSIGCRFIPYQFNRRGKNPLDDLKQLLFYVRLLHEIKPDITLTYTIKPNAYGGLACQLTGRRYLANVTGLGTSIENGGLLSRLSLTLYRMGLRKADCVFFQNPENQALFLKRKIVRGRSRLIPGSGVNLTAHSLKAYPSGEGETRFLFVGRVMRDKGVEELLTAFSMLRGEFSDVSLDIVGDCDDEETGRKVRSGARDGIRYHGRQDDVRPFYERCHCVVLPSYHEGLANVLLEGSATGRPVVATRVAGCRETFDEGVTGFGCEAGSAESLLDAMKAFLSLPWKDKERMGLRAREKMEREFNRSIVVEAYLEEIDRAAGRTGKVGADAGGRV